MRPRPHLPRTAPQVRAISFAQESGPCFGGWKGRPVPHRGAGPQTVLSLGPHLRTTNGHTQVWLTERGSHGPPGAGPAPGDPVDHRSEDVGAGVPAARAGPVTALRPGGPLAGWESAPHWATRCHTAPHKQAWHPPPHSLQLSKCISWAQHRSLPPHVSGRRTSAC